MAQILELPWPEPSVTSRVGKPTTRSRWQKQTHLHLRIGRLDKVRALNACRDPPHWHMEVDGVGIANVWNVDETFMKVLPMPKRAWSVKARPESPQQFVPEDKAGFTVKPGCLRP